MSSPYIGEIRIFAGNFAPAGWEVCAGQLLPISEFDALFNLIGTNYGGDGQATFALPDLRGRIPVHQGSGFVLGQVGGAETVSLTQSQLPAHTHALTASTNNATTANAEGNVPAQTPSYTPYIGGTPANTPLAPSSVSTLGQSLPHDNMQPYICINYIIALFGSYPVPS